MQLVALTACPWTLFAAPITKAPHGPLRKHLDVKKKGFEESLIAKGLHARPVLQSLSLISDVLFLTNFIGFLKNKKKKRADNIYLDKVNINLKTFRG